MRIPIRTSKLAIWSRRLGAFCLPLMLVPIVMHRERFITTPAFHTVELVAGATAALAVLLGIAALVRLWFSGDRGWDRALGGIGLGAFVLLPFAWLGWQAYTYPPVRDVSTTTSPLALTGQAPATQWTPQLREAVATAFPGAATRSYPMAASDVFAFVERLAAERGWEPRQRRAPVDTTGEGQINLIALTLFGWREEVAIRVVGTGEVTRVDMRSASPTDLTLDFGSNGLRIEEFLTALDGLANPNAARQDAETTPPEAEPEEEDQDAPAPEPPPDDQPVINDDEPVEG